MAKSCKDRNAVRIISNNGEIFVQSPDMEVYYRYPRWMFKINQKLLMPGLRRDHRKIIYVNGRRYGYAEYREGAIPLTAYLDEVVYWSDNITNFIKVHFGLGCRRSRRGYFLIKLGRTEYIVLRRYTKERNIFCQIYCKSTEEFMGSFIIDSAFTKVYPQFAVNNWVRSMYTIIGYIADAAIYSTVASQLNKTLEVVVR